MVAVRRDQAVIGAQQLHRGRGSGFLPDIQVVESVKV